MAFKLRDLDYGTLNNLTDKSVNNSGDSRRTNTSGFWRHALNEAFGKDTVLGVNDFFGIVIGRRTTTYAIFLNKMDMLDEFVAAENGSDRARDYTHWAYKVYIPEIEPRPLPIYGSKDPILRTYPDVYSMAQRAGTHGVVTHKVGAVVVVNYEDKSSLFNPRIVRAIGHINLDTGKPLPRNNRRRRPTRYSGGRASTYVTEDGTTVMLTGGSEDCGVVHTGTHRDPSRPDACASKDSEYDLSTIRALVPQNGYGILFKSNGDNSRRYNDWKKMWCYLEEYAPELSSYAYAAILGAIRAESRGAPRATNSIGAYGICQWLGSRKTKLIAYAASRSSQLSTTTTTYRHSGGDRYVGTKDSDNPTEAIVGLPLDLKTQIRFVVHELQNNHGWTKKGYNLLKATTDDPDSLQGKDHALFTAIRGMAYFERFAGWEAAKSGESAGDTVEHEEGRIIYYSNSRDNPNRGEWGSRAGYTLVFYDQWGDAASPCDYDPDDPDRSEEEDMEEGEEHTGADEPDDPGDVCWDDLSAEEKAVLPSCDEYECLDLYEVNGEQFSRDPNCPHLHEPDDYDDDSMGDDDDNAMPEDDPGYED